MNTKKLKVWLLALIINFLLIFVGWLLYNWYTEQIIRRTEDHRIEPFIFLLWLIAFFIYAIATKSKIIKMLSVGVFSLSISIILFLIFFFNRELAHKGSYEQFKLGSKEIICCKYYLNINFKNFYSPTEVPEEKFVLADSVYLRVDKGLFGMDVYSYDVRVHKDR